jgi:hypothetical protein
VCSSIWFGEPNTQDRVTAVSAKGNPAGAMSSPTPELARRTSSSARGFHEPALLLRELGRRLGRSRGHAVIGPPAEERDGVLRVKPAPLPPAHLFQQEGRLGLPAEASAQAGGRARLRRGVAPAVCPARWDDPEAAADLPQAGGCRLQAVGLPGMRNHTRLRAFELTDQLAICVYQATSGFPRAEMFGLTRLP